MNPVMQSPEMGNSKIGWRISNEKKIVKVLKSAVTVNLTCAMILQIPLTTRNTYAATATNTFVFSDSGISVSGSGSGYTIKDTTHTISSAGTYTVTGKCDEGSIVIINNRSQLSTR